MSDQQAAELNKLRIRATRNSTSHHRSASSAVTTDGELSGSSGERLNPQTRFLKRDEVRRRAGNIVDSTLYHWMSQGIFPRPVKLGPQRVGWKESDVQAWAEDPAAWAASHQEHGADIEKNHAA